MQVEQIDQARNKRHQSRVMRARTDAGADDAMNGLCPFGCADADLDPNGYCRHLVGFTNNTEAECKAGKGLLEPMVRLRGRYQVRVRRERKQVDVEEVETEVVDQKTGDVRRKVEKRPVYEYGPPLLERVLPSDQLERITVSSRVYRDVDKKHPAGE